MNSPASLSATKTPQLSYRSVIIAGLLCIGLFFGGLGGWAATAPLQGAVIAPGSVIVESYRKQVQHLTGGIVDSILVREGDRVEQGQVLIRLDGEAVEANRDLYRARMDSLQARQARLYTVLDNAEAIEWPSHVLQRAADPELAEVLRSETQIFEINRAARDSQELLYRARIRQQQQLVEGLQRQAVSIGEITQSMDEEIVAKRRLLDSGHIHLTHIMELQRAQNNNQARLEEVRTDRESARQGIESLELQIADLHQRYVQQAANELGQVRQAIVDLREQLRPAEDAARRLEIRAPESGVVVNVNVRTEGGVIRGGEPLMEIVPANSRLIVSARLEPGKIDDVYVGQPAKVTLSAFSGRRQARKVEAQVTYISADRIESNQQPPYYLVYLHLDPPSLQAAIGDASRLAPGMPAEVFIQTDARTMLSYLMSPITDSINRSFRE
jgi:HlyD family type I secretion membrane fusion protein